MMSIIAVDASITASILHIAISAYQLILALLCLRHSTCIRRFACGAIGEASMSLVRRKAAGPAVYATRRSWGDVAVTVWIVATRHLVRFMSERDGCRCGARSPERRCPRNSATVGLVAVRLRSPWYCDRELDVVLLNVRGNRLAGAANFLVGVHTS